MGLFKNMLDARAVNSLKSARIGLENAQKGASAMGQTRAAVGNILGNSAGGALVGGIGNAALYANRGEAIGGSYNTGDAFLTGAIGGAILGGAVGGFGAKAAMKRAGGNVAGATKRLEQATARMNRRGLRVGNGSRVKSNLDWKEKIPNVGTSLNGRAPVGSQGVAAEAERYSKKIPTFNARLAGKARRDRYLATSTKTAPINPVKGIETKYGVNPHSQYSKEEIAAFQAKAQQGGNTVAQRRSAAAQERYAFRQSMNEANQRPDVRSSLLKQFGALLDKQKSVAKTTPNVFTFADEAGSAAVKQPRAASGRFARKKQNP